jgi:putative membrane protein
MQMDSKPTSDPTNAATYFAAERTLLAWVRTGLAMMGFGFVVARFGLFLRELASVHESSEPHRLGVSLWVGTALVILGVIVNLLAAARHYVTIIRLNRRRPLEFHPLSLGIAVALVLALLGIVIAFYLTVELGDRAPAPAMRPAMSQESRTC